MFDAGKLKRWRWDHDLTSNTPMCEELATQLGVHPLVALLLHRRGLADIGGARSFLSPKLTDLHDPALLPGVPRAAERLARAVADHQPIVIYGDYDVDGIAASALLWHTLKLAGANVSSYVPHRIDEGYGLNSQAIRQLGSEGNPLIISVDCGITAIEPAEVAKQMGIDLIITDHHEFSDDRLPKAHTLVHPRLSHPGPEPEETYPFGMLCGTGVAFKLAWQFAKVHCGSQRLPQAFRDLLVDLLSLVALATVADVMPLVDENRVFTAFGLGHIKQTRFVGLNALIDATRLRDEHIDAYHVGFVLGPRLNACGRMGHARDAVKLLTTADDSDAVAIAQFLSRENGRRQTTERSIFQEAKQMVIDSGYNSDDCRAIVLGKEGWHPGVVGIVASRLVDTFCRPVVLLNYENGQAHGSARSIAAMSIHDALQQCDALLESWGGHKMAAGIRLSRTQVDAFRQAMIAYANQHLSPEDLMPVIDVEAECRMSDLTPALVDQMMRLAPFGRGNPAPLLCLRGVHLERAPERVGREGKHLRLFLRQDNRVMPAIGFGMGELAVELARGLRIDLAFQPKTSIWQGRTRTELHLKDLKISA